MQLKLRAFFIVLCFSALFAIEYEINPFQNPHVEVYGNQSLSEKEGILYYQSQPFTGVAIERFPNKKIYKSTEYRDGIPHGITEEFGFTGAIKHRWKLVNGIKEGLQYTWYLEGPKKTVQAFKNGLLHGQSKEWFINGQLFRERRFEKGLEVAHKVHYSTGELHTNYVKRDGAIYGLKSGELCMDFKDEGEL